MASWLVEWWDVQWWRVARRGRCELGKLYLKKKVSGWRGNIVTSGNDGFIVSTMGR